MAAFSSGYLATETLQAPRVGPEWATEEQRTFRPRVLEADIQPRILQPWVKQFTEMHHFTDAPMANAIKSVSGTVYKDDGSFASNTVVKLFRQFDDAFVDETKTDQQGLYVFPRDASDTYAYYVLAYIEPTDTTTPQVHGVSDRGVVPA